MSVMQMAFKSRECSEMGRFLQVQMMEDALAHHGIKGQKWGVRNAEWYPIAEWKKSLQDRSEQRAFNKRHIADLTEFEKVFKKSESPRDPQVVNMYNSLVAKYTTPEDRQKCRDSYAAWVDYDRSDKYNKADSFIRKKASDLAYNMMDEDARKGKLNKLEYSEHELDNVHGYYMVDNALPIIEKKYPKEAAIIRENDRLFERYSSTLEAAREKLFRGKAKTNIFEHYGFPPTEDQIKKSIEWVNVNTDSTINDYIPFESPKRNSSLEKLQYISGDEWHKRFDDKAVELSGAESNSIKWGEAYEKIRSNPDRFFGNGAKKDIDKSIDGYVNLQSKINNNYYDWYNSKAASPKYKKYEELFDSLSWEDPKYRAKRNKIEAQLLGDICKDLGYPNTKENREALYPVVIWD